MSRRLTLAALVAMTALPACSPSLNWREIGVGSTGLHSDAPAEAGAFRAAGALDLPQSAFE